MVNKQSARQQKVNVMFRIFKTKGLVNQSDYHAFCRLAKTHTDEETTKIVYRGEFK